MEIDNLIEQLIKQSRLAHMGRQDMLGDLLSKAAKTIKLLQEAVVDGSNEKYRRGYDKAFGDSHAE